jgi:hypothetical protein
LDGLGCCEAGVEVGGRVEADPGMAMFVVIAVDE